MEDKYYYKVRSIQSEVEHLAKEVKQSEHGLSSLVQSEKKRAEMLQLLARIQTDVKAIQDKTAPVFKPEFPSLNEDY